MKFTKMHGLGNDYVYVDGFKECVDDAGAAARAISDRHFGVGGDGMIVILPSDNADVRMRMFNNDGSEGEMCGNGVRCVAKYAFDHGLSKRNPLRVETGRGVLSIALSLADDGKVETARVDMDEPILALDQIGVVQGVAGRRAYFERRGEHAYGLAHEMGGMETVATFVSMGNPHMVIFVDDVARVDLLRHGPILERYPAFPKKTNVHFVQVNGRGERRYDVGAGQRRDARLRHRRVRRAGRGRADGPAGSHGHDPPPGRRSDDRVDETTNHVSSWPGRRPKSLAANGTADRWKQLLPPPVPSWTDTNSTTACLARSRSCSTDVEQIPSMRRLNRGLLPSRENAAESIERLLQLVFPGYFGKQGLTSHNLTFRVGEVAMGLSEQLYDQIRFCMRYREDRPDEETSRAGAPSATTRPRTSR